MRYQVTLTRDLHTQRKVVYVEAPTEIEAEQRAIEAADQEGWSDNNDDPTYAIEALEVLEADDEPA